MAPQVLEHPGTRPTATLAEGVTVDERRISPAGDAFYAAAKHRTATDESPHGCYNGWVYMGFGGEDENGEYGEDIERVQCRRCNERRRWVERGGKNWPRGSGVLHGARLAAGHRSPLGPKQRGEAMEGPEGPER
jgi:hypothetical protein